MSKVGSAGAAEAAAEEDEERFLEDRRRRSRRELRGNCEIRAEKVDMAEEDRTYGSGTTGGR